MSGAERYSPQSPAHVRRASESQYENIQLGYAEARRRLYPYEVPPWEDREPYNIWEDIADHLNPKSTETIIEFGTNDGYFHSVLRQKGFEGCFIGIDIESGGLAATEYLAHLDIQRLKASGKIAAGEAKFIQGDAQDLRGIIETSSIPAAAANFVTYHATDPDRILAELHRILKPGGIGAISSRNVTNQKDMWEVTRWVAHSHGFAFPQELTDRGKFVPSVPMSRISVYSNFDIDKTRQSLESFKKFRVLHEYVQDSDLWIPIENEASLNDLELVVESLLPYTVRMDGLTKPTEDDLIEMYGFIRHHMREFFIVSGMVNKHEIEELEEPYYKSHVTQGYFIVEAIKK